MTQQEMIQQVTQAAFSATEEQLQRAIKCLTSKQQHSKMITCKQTAEILNVHSETVKRWTREGKIQAVRLGLRKLRFRESDIIELANSGF